MKTKKIGAAVKTLLFFVPFIIGTAGYMLDDENSLHWAAAKAVQLYIGEIDYLEENLLVDIAMWLALIATASGVLFAFRSVRDAALRFVKGLNPETCAVYGDSIYAGQLAEGLKPYVIHADKSIPNARRHILMFDSDEENLNFLTKNAKELKSKHVYVKLDKILPHSLDGDSINAFSMAEITARLYWKKFPAGEYENIAIIGFDSLGRELLNFGLLLNILSNNQRISYHIWGDTEGYKGVHKELSNIKEDEIVFHNQNWQEDIFTAAEFDRVILCGEMPQNIINMSEIASYGVCPRIYIHTSNAEDVSVFRTDCEIIPFGTAKELADKEIILKESLVRDAKHLHEQYRTKYPSLEPWEQLSGFKKRSNIASADYKAVLKRLKEEGKTLEELSELEHIRWCRYHWLNNWSYAPKRDDGSKKHNMLIPYGDLSEEEKQKDRDNVKELLEIEPGIF